MSNWERKSSHPLREIVKFRTYIDFLRSRQFSVRTHAGIYASASANLWNRDGIRCLEETCLTAGPCPLQQVLVSVSRKLMKCLLQANTADDTSFRGIHLELSRAVETFTEAKLKNHLGS